MSLYAEVTPGGLIVDLVVWDGVSTYNVSPNSLVLATGQNAVIGGTYIGGVWTPPTVTPTQTDIVFTASPTAGSTVALPNAPAQFGRLIAYLTPAALLATLTLQMPSSPNNGDELIIVSSKTITTITYTPAVANAAITIALGGAIRMTYSSVLGLWIPW